MIYISWPLPVVADLAITKGYMRQTLPVSIKIKHHLHVQEITSFLSTFKFLIMSLKNG